jgi:hypothetical protein
MDLQLDIIEIRVIIVVKIIKNKDIPSKPIKKSKELIIKCSFTN